MIKRLTLILWVGLIATSCQKPKPSADYQEAQARFISVFGQKLEDAYGEPDMDDILAQLARVPKNSRDWRAAQDLTARIEQGRARLLAERKKTAAPLARVAPVVSPPPVALTQAVVEPVDAGPLLPQQGMSRVDFEKQFGNCFRSGETIYLNGKDPVESRVMLQLSHCRLQLPNFENKLVLLKGASVVSVVDSSQLKRQTVTLDAGIAAPSDGGR